MRARFASAMVVLVGMASRGHGQSGRVIRGTVLDARDQPIVAAAVIAVGSAGAVTDDSGRFRIELPHQDKVAFDVRRVGFMPSRVGLHAGGDTTISVLMLPAAQQLAGVAVTASAGRPAGLAGFEQRLRDRARGAGPGRFITMKDIEKMGADRTTAVLSNENSITVRRVAADRYAIFGKTSGGVNCAATIFLDGIRLMWGGQPIYGRGGRIIGREAGAPIDEFVHPSELAGVEVYPRAMLAPAQFQPPVNDDNAMKCAVVVVWTKHG